MINWLKRLFGKQVSYDIETTERIPLLGSTVTVNSSSECGRVGEKGVVSEIFKDNDKGGAGWGTWIRVDFSNGTYEIFRPWELDSIKANLLIRS